MTIKINDRWLWHQITIRQEYCDKCGTADSITIKKKNIKKLIKILKKLDYSGIPKRWKLRLGAEADYILKEDE